MKTVFLATATLLLAVGFAVAQQSPPAATGIGNQTSSPNSDVSNNPSFSPDQSQATTQDRGSSTGDKGNPDFAGGSGRQTSGTAQSQGTEGAGASTDATSGRRATYDQETRHHPAKAKRQHPSPDQTSGTKANTKETNRDTVPPEQGPSTTEAPGPATGTGNPHPQPPKNPD